VTGEYTVVTMHVYRDGVKWECYCSKETNTAVNVSEALDAIDKHLVDDGCPVLKG